MSPGDRETVNDRDTGLLLLFLGAMRSGGHAVTRILFQSSDKYSEGARRAPDSATRMKCQRNEKLAGIIAPDAVQLKCDPRARSNVKVDSRHQHRLGLDTKASIPRVKYKSTAVCATWLNEGDNIHRFLAVVIA